MNVKIRPQWVISLVVLVVMFIAARIYVGQAIERESRSEKQVREPAPGPAPKRAERPAPPPPRAPDSSGLVLRPLAHVSAVVEAGSDEEREAFYASARQDAAAVTAAIAGQVPVESRERILEQYQQLLATEDAAPVKAELTKLHADLKTWFATAPAPAGEQAPAPGSSPPEASP